MGGERRRRTPAISPAVQRTFRFVVALGLVTYEAILHDGEPRWLLVMLYATMMGLPLAELGDDFRRRLQGEENEP